MLDLDDEGDPRADCTERIYALRYQDYVSQQWRYWCASGLRDDSLARNHTSTT